MDDKKRHLIRLDLTLEEQHVVGTEPSLDLPGKKLALVCTLGDMARYEQKFTALTILNLRDNKLELANIHCFGWLPKLVQLDLRDNFIESVENVIAGLKDCDELEILSMLNCTANGSLTDHVDKYKDLIWNNLHGINKLDGIDNPNPLAGDRLAAVNFLAKTCGVGKNHLVDIDLSNQRLHMRHFMYVLPCGPPVLPRMTSPHAVLCAPATCCLR